MKALLVAGAACALLLSACASTSTSTPQMTEGKAVAALWASLQTASTAADVAVRAGKLKGPQAAAVSADLVKATQLIAEIDASYRAAPATDVTTQIAQAAALVADVLCVIQPAPACPVH